MKKLYFTLFFFLLSTIYYLSSIAQPAYAATCALGSSSVVAGNTLGFGYDGFPGPPNGQIIFIWDGGANRFNLGATLSGPQTISLTIPSTVPPGNYGGFIENNPNPAVSCGPVTVTAAGGGGGMGGGAGAGNIGTINPGTLPSVGGDPSSFVAGIIRAAISLLITVAFIVDLLWTIFAGLRFITAGGDPKTVGQAWTQIYWGLIGMVVVLGSFAIIKLVETFFGVNIITGGFQLPTI